MQGYVYLSHRLRSQPSDTTLQTPFVYSVEMAQVDDRWMGQAALRGFNAHSHGQFGHPQVASDSRHDGQRTGLIANVVLDNESRV